jgi:hypothetical protein
VLTLLRVHSYSVLVVCCYAIKNNMPSRNRQTRGVYSAGTSMLSSRGRGRDRGICCFFLLGERSDDSTHLLFKVEAGLQAGEFSHRNQGLWPRLAALPLSRSLDDGRGTVLDT